jgi:hypothetical protein
VEPDVGNVEPGRARLPGADGQWCDGVSLVDFLEGIEMIKVNFNNATLFRNEMNELVERLDMDVNGHDVQILRFDGDNNNLLVKVDESMNMMPEADVDAFILGRLGG